MAHQSKQQDPETVEYALACTAYSPTVYLGNGGLTYQVLKAHRYQNRKAAEARAKVLNLPSTWKAIPLSG